MLCQSCGENPAEIHYTEVVGGEKHTLWLCRACAARRGIVVTPISAENVLPQEKARPASGAGLRCPECGMDLATFQRVGKLGCPHCYEVFGDELDPILRRLHRTSEHKPPREEMDAQARLRRVLRGLRRELDDAVRQEEFELAARLRDEIRRYQEEAEALERATGEGGTTDTGDAFPADVDAARRREREDGAGGRGSQEERS